MRKVLIVVLLFIIGHSAYTQEVLSTYVEKNALPALIPAKSIALDKFQVS